MNLAEIIIWFTIFFYAAVGVLSIFQFYYLSLKVSLTSLTVTAFVLHLAFLVDLFVNNNLPFDQLSTWLYVISYAIACLRLSVRFKDGLGWSHAIFPFISAALFVGLLISKYPHVIVESISHQFILLFHIVLLLVGYILSCLVCVSCFLFWRQERQIKLHAFKLPYNRFPPLGKLDRSMQVFLKWSLFLQTGGLLFGVVLAEMLNSQSSLWRLGAASITWGVFACLALYLRFQRKQRVFHVILSIVGIGMIVGSLYFEFAYFHSDF